MAFNTLINPFGIELHSSSSATWGQVLVQHPITASLNTVTLYNDGHVTGPPEMVMLLQDYRLFYAAGVLETGAAVGSGRVFLLGDKDAITDALIDADPNNLKFSDNIAAWALQPAVWIKGNASLSVFAGDPTGIPVTFKLYSQGTLVETVTGTLDSNANYIVAARYAGTFDVLAKARQWLAVRTNGVAVQSGTVLNWSFDNNGDANNDNAVNLVDLSSVLADFDMTGPDDADLNGDLKVNLLDLSQVLADYNMKGDS